MAKGLRTVISDVGALATRYSLNSGNTRSIHICSHSGIDAHVDAVKLLEISRKLKVKRSQVQTLKLDNSVHVSFMAGGARWTAVILNDRVSEFFEAIGVDIEKLTSQPASIEQHVQRIEKKQLLLTCSDSSVR